MLKSLLKTSLLIATFAQAAYAAGVGGVWSTSTGDTLILMEKSANVVGADFNASASPKLRYALKGTNSGGHVLLANPAGTVQLDATLNGNTLAGTLYTTGSGGTTANPFSATLKLAYAGSGLDGLWQASSPAGSYLAYGTFSMAGVKTVLVPYMQFSGSKLIDYDLYIGSATTTPKGTVAYAGVSAWSSSDSLAMSFASATATTASGTFNNAGTVTKFTATLLKAVPAP